MQSTPAIHKPSQPPKPSRPIFELLARYRAVFAAAWQHCGELAGPKLLADEAAFLPAALSLQHTPVHPAPRRLAFALMALFAITLAWACIGKVDIVAVAPGRIIVGDRSKVVQPLERSVVQRVLVKDGDLVAAGQPLVELDPTSATADKTSVAEQLAAATGEQQRATALLKALASNGKLPVQVDLPPPQQAQLNAEWQDIKSKLAKYAAETARRQAEIDTARAQLAKLQTTLPLSQQREQDIKDLSAQGFMAQHAGQDRTRERIEQERDLATQQARLREAEAALSETRHAQAAYLAETTRNLHDRAAQADLKRQQASQELAKATQREKLTTLTAPVAGQVQQLAIHTTGGVVTDAQALMVIVPNETASPGAGAVVVEVTLDNKDIGFVTPGQGAEVKLETFPFTRYGTIAATVELVTADAVNDEKRGAIFPARLLLKASHINVDGKAIKLTPGMNVTAEIKTGQRRVIEYLLSPVQRAGQESLRER